MSVLDSLQRRLQPIGRRLPLLITALLTASAILISWAGYHMLARTLLGVAGQRAVAVSRRIGDALGDPQLRMRREGTALTRDANLLRALLHDTPPMRAAAQAVLDAERVRSVQVTRIEVWNVHGTMALAAGPSIGGGPPDAVSITTIRMGAMGPLRASHDTVFTELQLPVLGPAHDTVGIVREFTSLSAGQSSLLRDLVGSEASLYVGNASGNLWTDFHRKVAAPVSLAHLQPGVPTESTSPDGSRWIGALARASNLPWMVWVALPQAVVLAPARTYLAQLAAIALVVLVIGALGARMLSRRLIAPLSELTDAAEDIAGGNYGRRAKALHVDEFGRLAQSFNEMAGEIESALLNQRNQAAELEVQQTELEAANQDLLDSVTNTRWALTRAEESRARTTAIIAGAMDCVMTMDHAGVIVDFNPAAERTFGHAAADVIGRRVVDVIIPPAWREAHERGIARYLESGVSTILGSRVEFPALRADGTEFPAELTITRIPVGGMPSFTCFMRDLTARKRMEDELRQSQKLEAIGSLASGVAHDFNNILTVILNYGELVVTDTALSDSAVADVREMIQAARRATALTGQLLAFGRRQVLRPTVVDLNEVVQSMSGMLSRVLREDISYEVHVAACELPILVDRGQLEQVIVNLVVNARDAMPTGGTLLLQTMLVEPRHDVGGGERSRGTVQSRVELRVTDNGSGMDTDTRAKIFEPFFTTKETGQGTGLGLSTVHGIVTQSGGTIDVDTALGRGTTFRVSFPFHSASAVTPASVEVRLQGEDSTPATVLLIEDDHAVRASTSAMLSRLGYTVQEVASADEALTLIRAGEATWDVVVSDAMMPGMSGPELARIILKERPELPMVIMSGYAEDAVLGQGQVTANTVFVEKPFALEQLTQAIARAIRTVARPGEAADSARASDARPNT